jgi:hypothetical protein
LVIGAATPAAAPPAVAPAAPVRLHGEAARAADAVQVLGRALRAGDIESLCRPGAIFTATVVAEMNAGGESCEASDEVSRALNEPPALTVVGLSLETDLATAKVRIGTGPVVPLDIVRDGGRWLVSFSDGADPLGALAS